MNSKVADMKNACMGASSGPPTALAGLFIGTQIDYGGRKNTESEEKDEDKQKNTNSDWLNADWLHIDMAGLTALEKFVHFKMLNNYEASVNLGGIL
jgi:hypothetical protein